MFILISIKVPGTLEHIGTRVGGMIVVKNLFWLLQKCKVSNRFGGWS